MKEAFPCMNPRQPDTDGDGYNDGWECLHVADGFDPLFSNSSGSTGPDGDLDLDGLTNREECEWGTDPNNPDSDGDRVDDNVEIAQQSDPADGSDNGAANSRVAVSFNFGDQSDSHSEKYRLEVTPLQGVGTRPQTFRRINAQYGECETRTLYLKPGWSYEVRLFHSGTKPGETTDYDYTLSPVGDLPANVFLIGEDSLFGRHDTDSTGRPYAGDGKVAYLHALKVDVAGIKFNHASDACTNDAVNLRQTLASDPNSAPGRLRLTCVRSLTIPRRTRPTGGTTTRILPGRELLKI